MRLAVAELPTRSGRPYLAVPIPPAVVEPYLAALAERVGGERFEGLRARQQERDRGAFHLTVVDPNEVEAGTVIRPEEHPPFPITFLGLGRAESESDVAYYVVVRSEPLAALRRELGLGRRDLHVTLGFWEDDVRGQPRGESTVVVPLISE